MRKKMYKSGKNWVIAGTIIAGMAAINIQTASADTVNTTVPNNGVTVTATANVNGSSTETSQASASDATLNNTPASSVASVQDKINATQSVVNSLSAAHDSQQAIVDSANQPSAVSSASSAVSAAAQSVSDIQDKLTDAGHQVVTVSNAVTEKQSAFDQASATNSSAAAKTSEASQAVSHAQKDMNNALALSDNAQSVLNNDQQNIATANANVSAENNKLASIPSTIKGLPIATPTSDDETNDIYPDASTIYAPEQLPVTLAKPANAQNSENEPSYHGWYMYSDLKGNLDTSEKISNGVLTLAQQKELANYELTLINSFRKQNGLAPIHMTDETFNAALQEMMERSSKHIATGNHYVSVDYLYQHGFNFATAGQNLGSEYAAPKTMLEAKVNALNILTAMAYHDGAPGILNWGHRANLLLTKTDGQVYFAGYRSTDGNYLMDFYLFNNTEAAKLTSNIDTPVVNNNTGYVPNPAYSAQQNVVNNAKVALENAKSKYNDDLHAVTNVDKTVETAKQALKQAQQLFDAAANVSSNTLSKKNSAQKDLNTANTQLQLAQKIYSNLVADLSTAESVLSMAKENLSVVSDTNLLKQRLAESQQALAESQVKLTNDMATLKKAMDKSTTDKQSLASFQNVLYDATNKLAIINAQLHTAQESLNQAKQEQTEASSREDVQQYGPASGMTFTPTALSEKAGVSVSPAELPVTGNSVDQNPVNASSADYKDLNVLLPETSAASTDGWQVIAVLLMVIVSGFALVKPRSLK